MSNKFLFSPSARKLVTPTYEANVPTSGPVSPHMADWPSKMQDAVLRGAAQIQPACPVGYTRKIVATKPFHDPDGHYVKITIMDLPETSQ